MLDVERGDRRELRFAQKLGSFEELRNRGTDTDYHEYSDGSDIWRYIIKSRSDDIIVYIRWKNGRYWDEGRWVLRSGHWI